MKWKLTHGNRFLTLYEATAKEIEMVRLTFTKQIENARFDPKVKKGLWDGNICLFKSGKFLPSGLWNDLVKMCKEMDFEIHIDGIERMFDNDISLEEFTEWVNEKWKDSEMKPREYQIFSAFKVLKNKCCLLELATSSGKTLITFMVLAYLLSTEKSKRVLMIVPTVDLVIQGASDFTEYNESSLKMDLSIQQIYAGMKMKPESNLLIGTYQSLAKKEESFFDEFDCVVVDETHKAKGYSIQSILNKCLNSTRRFGLSGTIQKEHSLDRLTVMSQTGPVVHTIKADYLVQKGFITQCEIYVIEMDYAPIELRKTFHNIYKHDKENRKQVLELEKNYAIESRKRLDFITDAILKIQKNSLVLFHRIQYGQKLFDALREKTNRQVFYIDGSVQKDFRESFKDDMEDGSQKILVASYGTFSTGINVKNIHCVSLTESFKSDILIKQSIGRGLRLHGEKDRLIVLDFVDDYRLMEPSDDIFEEESHEWNNYLYLHSLERRAIYREENFKYTIKKVQFQDK